MFAPVRCCFDVMFLLFASLFALKPNLVRDTFERALEALKMIHAYTRNYHGCCGQFHVRSHALESRSGFYSQALTS